MNIGPLPIVGYGSQMLRQSCVEAEDTEETNFLVSALLVTMCSIETAVGLACPQINAAKRIFVMRPNRVNIVCINPLITKKKDPILSNEKCLSIPTVEGKNITRYNKIEVQFYDQHFHLKKMRLTGFEAIVFQHENDHLNGVLFTDHLASADLAEIKPSLDAIEEIQTAYQMIYVP